MRGVVDTNVVVSRYMTPTGVPAKVLQLWEQKRFDLVISPDVLAEYDRVLREPHIRRYHNKTDTELKVIMRRFRKAGSLDSPANRLSIVLNDPDDDRLLECAVAGKAEFIVSGDKHLLALGSYQGIQVLPPAAFVQLFDAAEKTMEAAMEDEPPDSSS